MTDHNEVFVFGSNRMGIHKRGAALDALKFYGAILGHGEGLQPGTGIRGRSYALPTKATPQESLMLPEIEEHVNVFLGFAMQHKEYKFLVTRVGCGLAGYQDADIAPMFQVAPDNCFFDERWSQWCNRIWDTGGV